MRSPINRNDRGTMSTQPSAKSTSRVLLAGLIGNVME